MLINPCKIYTNLLDVLVDVVIESLGPAVHACRPLVQGVVYILKRMRPITRSFFMIRMHRKRATQCMLRD